MPQIVPVPSDASPLTRDQLERIAEDHYDYLAYIRRHCDGVIDEAKIACESKYEERFYLWKDIYTYIPYALILAAFCAALWIVVRYRREIENVLIDLIGGAKKRKRRFSNHLKDVSERIERKADEP